MSGLAGAVFFGVLGERALAIGDSSFVLDCIALRNTIKGKATGSGGGKWGNGSSHRPLPPSRLPDRRTLYPAPPSELVVLPCPRLRADIYIARSYDQVTRNRKACESCLRIKIWIDGVQAEQYA